MELKNLTHTAISLTLIFISFLLFRGSTNIVNAVTVPLILYFNFKKFDWKEYITLILMTLIFSILFFFQQIFFIFLYFLLGIFLVWLFESSFKTHLRIIILTVIFFMGFISTLYITDLILGTALQQVLLSIMGGSITALIFFYLFNSLLVSAALIFVTPKIESKI